MSEWKKVSLSEMGIVSRGKSKHRPRNDARLYGGRYPFIQTGDIGAAGLYVTDYSQTYNEEGLAQSKLWEVNTLCITIAANIADTALLAFPACFPDSIMGFVPYKNVANVKYVKYCFDILKKDCQQISQGTAQDNLSWKKLSTIKFPCPPLEVQNRIATILSRYDSLIENYQKQIKLLEEAAQRLYKEWFVDLHFPGYETTKIIDGVPEGWVKKAFGSVVEYEIGGGWGSDTKTSNEIIPAYVIRGTDMNALDMGIWKELPYRFHQESNYRARQLMHNDIIFEVSGGSKNEGVAKTFLVQQELLDKLDNHVICASFCKLIRLKDSSIAYYIYDTLKEWRASGITAQYDKRSASSIVNYRWKDFLSQQEILIPKEIVLRDYIKKSELIHSSITKKSSQIRLLTEARDRLLPKLMSGEIYV